MRTLVGLLAFIFICLGITLGFAQKCQADNSYKVTATVPAFATVIVNQQGIITKILANTTSPESLIVRLNTPNANQVNITPSIVNQYNKLTANGHKDHPGVVYSAFGQDISYSAQKPSSEPYKLLAVFGWIGKVVADTISPCTKTLIALNNITFVAINNVHNR